MCGINGFISYSGISEDYAEQAIRKMNSDIIHRGPDENGSLVVDENNTVVAMGMQRLSIIDLATGKQPIEDASGKYVIVFNGEIYNYKTVKQDLLSKGYIFKTTSDTEVLLYAYIEYGEKCLQMLNGMFAFSILDRVKNEVFISRDRLGEKPLYYYRDSQKFVYASELKSIVRSLPPDFKLEINKKALSAYFKYTFIPSPLTIYNGVFKLEPAHFMRISLVTNEFKIQKYWDIEKKSVSPDVISYDDAKQKVHQMVMDSTALRMEADVPLGVFLSGGIDSSIVAYSMAAQSTQRIKTFSIGFSNYKAFDETERAALVAKHINSEHHQIDLDFNILKDDIDKVILNYDEPFADSSALPSYWVSKATVGYVKVALTGDGGDEAFGGYNRYLLDYYNKKLSFLKYLPTGLMKTLVSSIPEKEENRSSLKFRLMKLIESYDKDLYKAFFKVVSLGFKENQLNMLINENYLEADDFIEKNAAFKSMTPLSMMRNIDRLISLDGDMCVKVDRASMLASLECRAPFLDHRLFELSNTFPDEYLLTKTDRKKILKDAFRDQLPTGLFEMPKSGFGVPIGTWLRKDLKDELLALTEVSFIKEQGIFKNAYIQTIINEHLSGKADHTFKVWSIFCFQKWYLNTYVKN